MRMQWRLTYDSPCISLLFTVVFATQGKQRDPHIRCRTKTKNVGMCGNLPASACAWGSRAEISPQTVNREAKRMSIFRSQSAYARRGLPTWPSTTASLATRATTPSADSSLRTPSSAPQPSRF
ncbi:uncharacterized protein BKA78DRAFT_58068 [Phyllosticta capitalensis]|uniref:uncharacterized protein n=1 Tax=Phyllosticta capitalensis TaxID=121624 RepID=UPI00312D79E9